MLKPITRLQARLMFKTKTPFFIATARKENMICIDKIYCRENDCKDFDDLCIDYCKEYCGHGKRVAHPVFFIGDGIEISKDISDYFAAPKTKKTKATKEPKEVKKDKEVKKPIEKKEKKEVKKIETSQIIVEPIMSLWEIGG